MTGPEEGRGAGGEAAAPIWVVDRIEGRIAVLVADAGGGRTEVPLARLPGGLDEGAVLRVPQPGDQPAWKAASVDDELRRARLDEAEGELDRLRRRDPGGDISL